MFTCVLKCPDRVELAWCPECFTVFKLKWIILWYSPGTTGWPTKPPLNTPSISLTPDLVQPTTTPTKPKAWMAGRPTRDLTTCRISSLSQIPLFLYSSSLWWSFPVVYCLHSWDEWLFLYVSVLLIRKEHLLSLWNVLMPSYNPNYERRLVLFFFFFFLIKKNVISIRSYSGFITTACDTI